MASSQAVWPKDKNSSAFCILSWPPKSSDFIVAFSYTLGIPSPKIKLLHEVSIFLKSVKKEVKNFCQPS